MAYCSQSVGDIILYIVMLSIPILIKYTQLFDVSYN